MPYWPYLVTLFLFGNFFSCEKKKEVVTIQNIALSPPIAEPIDSVAAESPAVRPEFQKFLTAYSNYIDALIRRTGTPGGAIVVVKGGYPALIKPFGKLSSESDQEVDSNTIFRVGSVSKTFAAALCGVLVQKGYLEWSTPVAPYVPVLSFKRDKQLTEMQLQHILAQTTGMPRHTYTDMIEYHHPLYEIFAYMPDVDILYPPGRIHSYQNVLYSASGEMAEAVTGLPYEDLLQTFLFEPLQMTRSSASYESMQASSNIAEPHKWRRRGAYLKHETTRKYYQTGPAGGVNTSATDMSTYLLALLGHKPEVLGTEVLDSLFEPKIYTPVRYKYFRNWEDVDSTYYAMGFRVATTASDTLIYHGGYVDGFRAAIGLNRKEDVGIAIILNAPTEVVTKGIPAFFRLYEEYKPTLGPTRVDSTIFDSSQYLQAMW